MNFFGRFFENPTFWLKISKVRERFVLDLLFLLAQIGQSHPLVWFIEIEWMRLVTLMDIEWMWLVKDFQTSGCDWLTLQRTLAWPQWSDTRTGVSANHILYIGNLRPITSTRFQLTKRVETQIARKTSEQVTVCVLSLKMSCVFNVERTRLRGRDCCLSVRKRDKERNSFRSAFCFIQPIFQWTGYKHI